MIVVFGYAVKHPDQPCAVNAEHPARTLCRRTVLFLPVQTWDGVPPNLHPACADIMRQIRADVRPCDPRDVVCPVCVGPAPAEGGLVGKHPQWTWQGGMSVPSDRWCLGAGETPEVD